MRFFALVLLGSVFPGVIIAQSGCPANIKGIPLHTLNRHQMVVSVFINHSGPYEFLLDTGTQMTVVDRALASDLGLLSTGNAAVAGVSVQGAATFARLDSLELGDHSAANQGVVVYDMKNVQGAGFSLRGLLGEDFLSRYDVLIEKAQALLCIDDTGAMLGSLRDGTAPSGPGVGEPGNESRPAMAASVTGPGRR